MKNAIKITLIYRGLS